MTRAESVLVQVFGRGFKPRTHLNTHEWARQNVRLDSRFTVRPGPYDVNYTPYMKGPHEAFSDPYTREVTFAKCRQVGGTTFLANCMMYAVGEDPGPGLYVTSTQENALSFAEREWIPRVDLSPCLTKLKPDDPDLFKKREQHFKNCTFKLVGSNSPANLMSRAIRWLFEDETDTWPIDDGEDEDADASAIDTVEACTLSYAHAKKILRVSTPTDPTGTIWTYFLRGSQHKFYVPCPHCNHKFVLQFEQLNFHKDKCWSKSGGWDLDKVKTTTSLTCPGCSKDIHQRNQMRMVGAGEWRQTNPNAPREHLSFHISALYSPTVSWGDMAKTYLEKKDKPGGMRDFYNHYLGLPFVRRTTAVTVSDIERVQNQTVPEYCIRPRQGVWTAPVDFELALMAVDVQQNGFWWVQRGVDLNETSYLIDYGPASHWDDLLEIFVRPIPLPNGTSITTYKALIDMGYAAKKMSGVYDFCLRSGGKFYPVQGRSAAHGLWVPLREVMFEHRGQYINGVQLRDDLYKEELYIRRIKERAGAGWMLPRHGLGEDYKAQLSDEQLVEKTTPRGKIMEFEDGGNNHLGDAEKYLLGAIDLISPYLKQKREGDKEPEKQEPEAEPTVAGEIPRTPRESARLRPRDD